jgi:hypothetical protein
MQCKALVVQVWVIHLPGETADEPVTAQKYGSENGASRFQLEPPMSWRQFKNMGMKTA